MQRKKLLVALLGLGLMGTLGIGAVNATTTVTPLEGETVNYTLNGNEQFSAGVLQIDDGETKIFILDRNLGATAAGTGCEDPNFLNVCSGGDATYGYHFQWGNNYGFDPMDDSITANSVITKEPWLIEYSNKGYIGSVFIKSTVAPYDYWSDNGNHYDVWGGLASDVPNYDNNGVWKITNGTGRQGPCPSGFHVPSYGELSKLWSMFNNSVSEIHRNLLLPFAGYRGYSDAIVYNLGTWANVDTSSPNVSLSTQVISPYNKGTSLCITGTIGIGSASRANGVSVRCFYDYYNNYTKQVSCVESGEIPAHSHYDVKNITLTRDEQTGWPEPSNCSFVCDEGYYGDNCLISLIYNSGDNITYVDTEGNEFTGIGTITFAIGDYSATILDRNLGATKAVQPSRCSEYGCWGDVAFGYYFQWGNNYGFTSESAKLSAISTQVDAGNYSWSNPYVSGVFVSGYNNWDSNGSQNLWGGEWDTTLLGTEGFDFDWFSDTTDIGYTMQGPCPEGYHIPSKGEWGELIKAFYYYYVGAAYESDNFDGNFQVNDVNFRTKFDSSFRLPYAGYLSNTADLLNSTSYGYLWTNTPEEYAFDTDGHAALSLRFFWNRTTNYVSRNKSFGLPIRCFKDKGNTGFVLSYDTRGGTLMQGQTIPASGLAHVPGYDPKKTGHVFLGRYSDEDLSIPFAFGYTEGIEPEILTRDKTIYAKWDDDIIVTFLDYDGHKLDVQIVHEGDSAFTQINPIRNGYTFVGWDKSLDNITEDLIVTAIYEENKKSNGGGSTLKKDSCPNGDFSDSYYDGICGENPKDSSSQTTQNDEQTSQDDGGSNELQTAYEFAYENKITTMDTIEKADMEGGLTRIAMAKMLSQYAINVLGKKPANKVVPQFTDITEELDAEYDYGVSLAYQLGIMGINMPENKFRPFDKVTRAEFVTALSRLLYNIEDGEILYYSTHMELLNKMGIITVTDPDMKELRGYVMLMLMRSAK